MCQKREGYYPCVKCRLEPGGYIYAIVTSGALVLGVIIRHLDCLLYSKTHLRIHPSRHLYNIQNHTLPYVKMVVYTDSFYICDINLSNKSSPCISHSQLSMYINAMNQCHFLMNQPLF